MMGKEMTMDEYRAKIEKRIRLYFLFGKIFFFSFASFAVSFSIIVLGIPPDNRIVKIAILLMAPLGFLFMFIFGWATAIMGEKLGLKQRDIGPIRIFSDDSSCNNPARRFNF